jgi:hypothetical protein
LTVESLMVPGAGRSEVKKERRAKPDSGDMSGALHPAPSARHMARSASPLNRPTPSQRATHG